ncbi:MAG: apiosidase-like domain-containing protein [Limisphaerales bacterium]
MRIKQTLAAVILLAAAMASQVSNAVAENWSRPDPPPSPPPSVASFETNPARLIGCGLDRNGDLLNPDTVARALKAAHLNATSVGFFGHDSADPHNLDAARRWLTPWLAAMRAQGILTVVTITGTGGPDGGLSRAEFSDEWFTACINLLVSLGTNGVMVCPVAEGCIKEGADEPTRSKIFRWHHITAARWPGMKGWNFQPRPSVGDVPPGWTGIVHPQSRRDGYPGCLILTDAPLFPRYKTGRYPNEVIIPSELTSFVRQVRAAGKGYIEWGTWERAEIDTAAIKAVGAAVAIAPEPTVAPAETLVCARWETALHSSKTYGNSYRDLTLRVTYIGPTGQVQQTYGFWDGGDTFRIRCAFPAPGLWHWRTECSDPANTGLHAQTGTVNVTPYRGDNPLYRHGFLRVSDNRRYLCQADGTPFLWMGDTAWVGPMKSTEADWETYLADRVSKHFTVIQIGPAPWWAGKQNAAGTPPFIGDGIRRLNPAFWQAYERRVQRANERGLFVLMVGVMEPTTRYPTAADARLFARQIAARLYGNFVAFSPSFDSGYRELGNEVGAAIRDATHVHLITEHPGTTTGQPVNTIAEAYFDQPYLDFAGDQTGHNSGRVELCARQAIEWNLHLYHREPHKPVINLEAMYDTGGQKAFNAYGARSLGWRSWLSGAMGYTYGTDLYQWETDPSKPAYWREAMSLPSSGQMTHLHDFLAKIEWWRLEPAPELVRNPSPEFLHRSTLARTAHGDLAVAYFPDQARVDLDLSGFPSPMSARWYDPSSGRYIASEAKPVPNRGDHHFTPPGRNSAGDGDWVLVLQAEAR